MWIVPLPFRKRESLPVDSLIKKDLLAEDDVELAVEIWEKTSQSLLDIPSGKLRWDDSFSVELSANNKPFWHGLFRNEFDEEIDLWINLNGLQKEYENSSPKTWGDFICFVIYSNKSRELLEQIC